jgi:hypothetical protein
MADEFPDAPIHTIKFVKLFWVACSLYNTLPVASRPFTKSSSALWAFNAFNSELSSPTYSALTCNDIVSLSLYEMCLWLVVRDRFKVGRAQPLTREWECDRMVNEL